MERDFRKKSTMSKYSKETQEGRRSDVADKFLWAFVQVKRSQTKYKTVNELEEC